MDWNILIKDDKRFSIKYDIFFNTFIEAFIAIISIISDLTEITIIDNWNLELKTTFWENPHDVFILNMKKILFRIKKLKHWFSCELKME